MTELSTAPATAGAVPPDTTPSIATAPTRSVGAASRAAFTALIRRDLVVLEKNLIEFVTRTLVEEGTGREMAAVYIPTTPNPTGGYLELVPMDELTPTDWTMDQAMAFIISGGAVSPESLHLIDSSIVRAHQHAAGGKKGARITPSVAPVGD